MAHVWADRVAETTTTTGTGALALTAATGYQRFSAVCSVNDTVIYAIEAVDGSGVPTGDWEVGVGTYSAANTLTRTTPLKSSNSNLAVSFAAGTKNVFLDDAASTRNTLQQYSGTSEPSAPVEGLIFWAHNRNGYSLPLARGAAQRSNPINPMVGGRSGWGYISSCAGLGVTTASGSAVVASANLGAVNPLSTNAYTSISRGTITTTSTASQTGGARSTSPVGFIRAGISNSGVFLCMTGGMETVGNTNCRWFMGLLTSGGAPAATFDPNSTASQLLGVGASGADTTNAKLYMSNGVTVTSVDLGSSFPAKTGASAFIELSLYAPASGATIFYHIRRLDDLTVTPVTGSLTTNLPTAALMYPHWTINNNATAAASLLAWGSAYWESGV